MMMAEKEQHTDKSARKNKSITECQSYHYSQSSKVSSIARTVVMGIIGTVWVLIYSDSTRSFNADNINLLIVMSLCFIYLLVDIGHYFRDAVAYRRESLRLHPEDECYQDRDIDWGEYESRMVGYTECSYRWFVTKFVFLCVISVYFITIMIIMILGMPGK